MDKKQLRWLMLQAEKWKCFNPFTYGQYNYLIPAKLAYGTIFYTVYIVSHHPEYLVLEAIITVIGEKYDYYYYNIPASNNIC